ncbi:MAG TPA: exodeoxyribonuclease VII large subunit, partial [Candidatus Krumholzibacteria bacterium]|nr:exodeoxyribonuclease VII large subunit [Candidatus Krumholzibacteria bacterium]
MAYEDRQILTVRQVNQRVSDALAASFPGTLWVRGEIQRLPYDAARRQHVYFELHETGATGAAEYQVPVSLMGWDRDRYGLGRYLDGTDPDLQLADKLEVCFEVRVDYYAKFGKLSLKIVGVDKTFSLGRLEAARRATLAFLQEQGLLETNGALALAELPLTVGLITSPGSAAEQDFLTGLVHSGWAFRVVAAPAKMQGERVQAEVIAGLHRLAQAGVDVIVITRGGGSRADLSWFDQRDLAVAVARCPVPVVTAIGHEIDRSIADLVAHHACKTPTAAAEYLVDRIDRAAARVDDAEARLLGAVGERLEDAARRLDMASRLKALAERRVLTARVRVQRQGGRLQQTVGRSLAVARHRLAGRGVRLGAAAARGVAGGRQRTDRLALVVPARGLALLERADRSLLRQRERLAREALRPLGGAEDRLRHQ